MSYIHIEVKKTDQANGQATVILTEPVVASHLVLEGYSVNFEGAHGTGDHTKSCIKVVMPLSERQILSWVNGGGPRNSLVLPIEGDRMSTVNMGIKLPIGVQNIHIPQSFQIEIQNEGNEKLENNTNTSWVVHLYFSFKRASLF